MSVLILSHPCHRVSYSIYIFANPVRQKEFCTFVFILIFLSLYSSAKGPLAEESIICEDLKKSSGMSSRFRAALRKDLMPMNAREAAEFHSLGTFLCSGWIRQSELCGLAT